MKIKETLLSYINKLNSGIRYKKNINTDNNYSEIVKNKPVIINILLFIITCFTTSFAGASSGETFIEYLISGVPYSITIITILLSHEFGHYFAARYFGVKATLPYFIPFPSIVGTMGAIIKVKSPIPNRRALFYIGAMGPISGFIISIIVVIIGIFLSQIRPLPTGGEEMTIPIFGDSLLFAILVKAIHGNIPHGHDIFLSPYAWAGWLGFLVTSLNLMPVGQLDGSHILYAIIGRKQVYFGWGVLAGLIILSFFWIGWIFWIIFILFFLLIGHPPVNEDTQLSIFEKSIGWSCMLIFLFTFIPVPVKFI